MRAPRGVAPGAAALRGARAATATAAALLLLPALACARFPLAPLPDPLPPPLPPLPVAQVAEDPGVPATPGVATPPAPAGAIRVTFTARDAPLQDMLLLLAEAAGVTLLIDPEVEALVSFRFDDVPALEALELLALQAGYALTDLRAEPALPFRPRTVFFVPPVNVNTVGVAAIQARFGVSRELAEWIVTSRVGGR